MGQYKTLNNFANEFSTATSYASGDFVMYLGELYRCIEAHSAGSWNANHFVKTSVTAALASAGGGGTKFYDPDGFFIERLNLPFPFLIDDGDLKYLANGIVNITDDTAEEITITNPIGVADITPFMMSELLELTSTGQCTININYYDGNDNYFGFGTYAIASVGSGTLNSIVQGVDGKVYSLVSTFSVSGDYVYPASNVLTEIGTGSGSGGTGGLYKHVVKFGTAGAEGQPHINFIDDNPNVYTAPSFIQKCLGLLDGTKIFIPQIAGWGNAALSTDQVFNYSLSAVIDGNDDISLRIAGYPAFSTSTSSLDNVVYNDFTELEISTDFSDTVTPVITGGGSGSEGTGSGLYEHMLTFSGIYGGSSPISSTFKVISTDGEQITLSNIGTKLGTIIAIYAVTSSGVAPCQIAINPYPGGGIQIGGLLHTQELDLLPLLVYNGTNWIDGDGMVIYDSLSDVVTPIGGGSGDGTGEIKYIIELEDSNNNKAIIPITKTAFDKYLIEMNQVGQQLANSLIITWTTITDINGLKATFDDLKTTELAYGCDLAMNLLVKYAYESGQNPVLQSDNRMDFTIELVGTYDLQNGYLGGVFSQVDIEGLLTLRWFKEEISGGSLPIIRIDQDATMTYTQEVISGGSGSGSGGDLNVTKETKKWYKWTIEDTDNNSYNVNVNAWMSETDMQELYAGINQAMSLNISTPQEIIALYNQMKMDDYTLSQQTEAIWLQLNQMFGFVVSRSMENNKQVRLYVPDEDSLAYPTYSFAMGNLAPTVGTAVSGESSPHYWWAMSKATSSGNIAFSSTSTLRITEETETYVTDVTGGGSGTGSTKSVYEFSLKTSTDGNAISTDNYVEMIAQISKDYFENEFLPELNTRGQALATSLGETWTNVTNVDSFVALESLLHNESHGFGMVIMALLVQYCLKENRLVYTTLEDRNGGDGAVFMTASTVEYAVALPFNVLGLCSQGDNIDDSPYKFNAKTWFSPTKNYAQTELCFGTNAVSSLTYIEKQEASGGSTPTPVSEREFDYVQFVNSPNSIEFTVPHDRIETPEAINNTNALITAVNSQFSINIPAYTGITSLPDIFTYVNSLNSSYEAVKVMLYSATLEAYLAMSTSVVFVHDVASYPVSVYASFDELDPTLSSFSIKYLSDSSPLSYTTWCDEQNRLDFDVYVNR